jgi:hypothetical protein
MPHNLADHATAPCVYEVCDLADIFEVKCMGGPNTNREYQVSPNFTKVHIWVRKVL